ERERVSRDASAAALAKAERYRLLNESAMAESICEDILGADPGNQQALVTLILALSDQFRDPGVSAHTARARALLPGLRDEYDRLYYAGIISERRARAQLAPGGPGMGSVGPHWFSRAVPPFERAIAVCPPGDRGALRPLARGGGTPDR